MLPAFSALKQAITIKKELDALQMQKISSYPKKIYQTEEMKGAMAYSAAFLP